MEQFYTTKEVAEMMKVSVWAVRDWIEKGKLKAAKVGKVYRISESNLKSMIKEAEQEPLQ